MCVSRKNLYPHHGGTLEILRRREFSIAKFLRESMKLIKTGNSREERSANQITILGRYGYFLEPHSILDRTFSVEQKYF